MKYIKNFNEVTIEDIVLVGGKNASLGQMIQELSHVGVVVPGGFAVTAQAYWHHIDHNHLREQMHAIMAQRIDINNHAQLTQTSSNIRQLIESFPFPKDLEQEIIEAYNQLFSNNASVAVRSSATAEDLPTASFAGQQETFLNVVGIENLLVACKKSMSSLFTPRAIVYREVQGFNHFDVALSVGVQYMVRADKYKGASGVAFSVDTESGFKDVVMIESSWGLGEAIVKGEVTPDLFVTYKPTGAIIKKQLGDKTKKIVFSDAGADVHTVTTTKQEQDRFSLTDNHIEELSRAVITIEAHYSQKKGAWSPMDVEWAVDGTDNRLYIIQARPETIHGAEEKNNMFISYYLQNQLDAYKKELLTGQSIGKQIATGIVRIVTDVSQIDTIKEGDVLVTSMTDPDWVPAMKKAAAIITERGGRTCHAAIVSRELSVAVIVGVQGALTTLQNGQEVTIDCSRGATGYVYDGVHAFEKKETVVDVNYTPPVDIMLNIADPDSAFSYAYLPVSGVGLARLEFIIANQIGIHPRACLEFEKVTDEVTREKIMQKARSYVVEEYSLSSFFIEELGRGIAMIAAAFYPKPVIVRLSDFKTNEYRNLLGGKYFEHEEENPMLGFRGASRYYHENFKEAFELELAAIKWVRSAMGFTNIHIMVPFVRTIDEAQKINKILTVFDLKKDAHLGKNIPTIMMCEVPSNVVLIEKFAQYFDGFSIGSNDLTQLVLGLDRDSEIIASLFDEQDEAVKKMIAIAIDGARRQNKSIGICGQGPSDFPEFGDFLIKEGITSLSLNPDAVLPYIQRLQKK